MFLSRAILDFCPLPPPMAATEAASAASSPSSAEALDPLHWRFRDKEGRRLQFIEEMVNQEAGDKRLDYTDSSLLLPPAVPCWRSQLSGTRGERPSPSRVLNGRPIFSRITFNFLGKKIYFSSFTLAPNQGSSTDRRNTSTKGHAFKTSFSDK